jgi:hypothetical protein
MRRRADSKKSRNGSTKDVKNGAVLETERVCLSWETHQRSEHSRALELENVPIPFASVMHP